MSDNESSPVLALKPEQVQEATDETLLSLIKTLNEVLEAIKVMEARIEEIERVGRLEG